MDKVKLVEQQNSVQNFFIDYINFLEAAKTFCKSLHWGAENLSLSSKASAHKYLDGLYDIISEYEDTIAEVSQGIYGTFPMITGKQIPIEKPLDIFSLIDLLKKNIFDFYKGLPDEVEMVGMKSETETFIKNIQKYTYLFNLCK